MTTLSELSHALKANISPGGLVIFQVESHHMPAADRILRQIDWVFKKHEVGMLLLSEDVTIVMVPEARRILTLPLGIA